MTPEQSTGGLPATTRPATSRARLRVQAWVVAHPLGGFVLLAYGISWVFFIPAALGLGPALVVLGAFGPAIAAALVTRWTGGSVRTWLVGLRRWRVPGRFYLYALGLPLLLVGAAEAELAALGHAVSLPALPTLAGGYLGTLILAALLGGGQEEPGWRGFALDRYQATHSPLVATALLGLVWGAWHLPVYGLGGFGGPVLFVVFYTWLYNRTGSVLLCTLMHASFNTAVGYLKLADSPAIVSVMLVATVATATGLLLVATGGRLGADRRPAGLQHPATPSRPPIADRATNPA